MSAINYPVGLLVDNSGVILTAPVVTVTAITTAVGGSITTADATVNQSGTANPISVSYDAAANGEAFITLSVSQSGHTITGANASIVVFAAVDSSKIGQMSFDGSGYINADAKAIAAGAIGVAQFSSGMAALLGPAYLVTTGMTTPATADTWITAGLYNGIRYYQGIGTGLCAWYNGTNWIISSTPGTNGTAYWQGGSTVNSAYTNMGTATGTPTVTPHGNSILAAYQPESPLPTLDGSGNVGLSTAAILNVWNEATSALTTSGTIGNKLASNTNQTGDSYPVVTDGTHGLAAIQTLLSAVDTLCTNISTAVSGVAATVWNALLSGMTTVGSAGKLLAGLLFDSNGYLESKTMAYGTNMDPASEVLNAVQTSYNTAGSIGHAIGAASSAGDPWNTVLPGSYGAGTAGYIVGQDLPNINSGIATALTALTAVEAGIASIEATLVYVQGLVGVNSGVKNAIYSGTSLQSADIYLYDSAVHATANDGVTGVLHHISLNGSVVVGNLVAQVSSVQS